MFEYSPGQNQTLTTLIDVCTGGYVRISTKLHLQSSGAHCKFIEGYGLDSLSKIAQYVFSSLSKDPPFKCLFAITAVGVVSFSGPKQSPHRSSILQIKFYFWSIEISWIILRI